MESYPMSKSIQDLIPLSLLETQTQMDPKLMDIGDTDAVEVFDALSSETTRKILIRIREDPCLPTDIAGDLDTSIQNVHYHLNKLEDVNLIEPAGIGYSKKGVEMTLYTQSNNPLVITSATENQQSILRTMLGRLFAGIALLAGVSFGVQWLFANQLSEFLSKTDGTTITSKSVESVGNIVPPGLLFFLGGLFVLLMVLGWQYRKMV